MQVSWCELDNCNVFDSVAASKISNRRCLLRWTIQNLCKFRNRLVRSDEFCMLSDIKCAMEASMRNGCLKYFYMINFLGVHKDVKVDIQLSVFDCEGKRVYNTSFPNANPYGPTYLSIDVSPVINNNLAFVFETNITETNIATEVNRLKISSVKCLDMQEKFCGDLKSIFRDSRYSDVNLCVDGITVLAHKAILSARSSVFANLLSRQSELLSESTSFAHDQKRGSVTKHNGSVLNIGDISSTTLKKLVEFLYTSLVSDIDFEEAYQLYDAAFKYAVDDLQKICTYVLFSKLDMKNACRISMLADRYNDSQLKTAAMHFIMSNLGSLTSMDQWFELITTCTNLAKEIVFNFPSDNNENHKHN